MTKKQYALKTGVGGLSSGTRVEVVESLDEDRVLVRRVLTETDNVFKTTRQNLVALRPRSVEKR